ncbi:ABC transporter substrate-binding protein [Pseudomonas sp. HR96]|uniref:ABC transporter substrate-binding protein n=1 Tax=Pseudomonas sp. HR96 TaxID=1027966 RepID=UPI002A75C67B|nr:ABC transporter substrate-binding protein [Pseudomonas sp. HR96]WPO97665.1 ABC transporter substrate-binding protein [Pseudomonas sp. HR96]
MIRRLIFAGAIALTLSGAAQAAAHYPLTLNNCGRAVTVAAPPQRAVSLGQASTELLLALGLGPRMVGSGVWFGALPAELQASGAQVPRLADNAPSLEKVLSTRPDMVVAQYTYHIGPTGEVATPQQLGTLGIPAYVSPADCDGKAVTATSNADGSRDQLFSMDLVYKEIKELASIFDVEPAGERLTARLRQRVADAQASAARQQHRPLSVLYWFSSSRLAGDPWVAGRHSAPGYIAQVLGLRNVVDSDEEWPAVSWETIAARDPDVIVLTRMQRRLYPADDVERKLAFLRSDPVTRQLKAVRNNRLIIVDAQTLNPSMAVVDAIEQISAGLATP